MVAHQDDDSAGNSRDNRRLVITKYARLAAHYNVTNHGSTRGSKYAHHDARNQRQTIGNGLHGAGGGPQAGNDGVAMRLQVIPGLALEIDKAGNQRAGKSQI